MIISRNTRARACVVYHLRRYFPDTPVRRICEIVRIPPRKVGFSAPTTVSLLRAIADHPVRNPSVFTRGLVSEGRMSLPKWKPGTGSWPNLVLINVDGTRAKYIYTADEIVVRRASLILTTRAVWNTRCTVERTVRVPNWYSSVLRLSGPARTRDVSDWHSSFCVWANADYNRHFFSVLNNR